MEGEGGGGWGEVQSCLHVGMLVLWCKQRSLQQTAFRWVGWEGEGGGGSDFFFFFRNYVAAWASTSPLKRHTLNACTHLYVHALAHAYMYACTHTCTHICTHTDIHVIRCTCEMAEHLFPAMVSLKISSDPEQGAELWESILTWAREKREKNLIVFVSDWGFLKANGNSYRTCSGSQWRSICSANMCSRHNAMASDNSETSLTLYSVIAMKLHLHEVIYLHTSWLAFLPNAVGKFQATFLGEGGCK